MKRLLLSLTFILCLVAQIRVQWIHTNGPSGGYSFYSLAVSGNNMFAGTNGGVFVSTDNGESWTQRSTGLPYNDIYTIAVSGSNLFAGTPGGVFQSANNGANWSKVNTGLTNTSVKSLAASESDLFAGTEGGGVFSMPLNLLGTSGVETGKNPGPDKYSLEQNYPNPFNPSTNITFSLPKSQFVSLRLYDILGNEAAVLVNGYKEAGTYTVHYDASNLPSGIYIYTIRAGQFTDSKKLLLFK